MKNTWILGIALAAMAPLAQAQIGNGSFETGDFTSWGTYEAGAALLFVGSEPDDTCGAILSSDGITDGTQAAYLSMTSPNTTSIWQDFVVPDNALLSLDVTYDNEAAFQFTGALDHTGNSNQHMRIDIMDPTADDLSVDPGDTLMTLLVTDDGSPSSIDRQSIEADLSSLAGQTVRLRVAKTDNLGCFPAVVDNVVIGAAPVEIPVPANQPWALILMMLALALTAMFTLRRPA